MSLAGLMSRTAVVVQIGATGTDRYNDPVIEEVARRTYPCYLEPLWLASGTRAAEHIIDRQVEVGDYLCVLPADAVVTPEDRVQIEGAIYEVSLPVGRPHTPRGEHHVEVLLRLVEGT